MVATLRGLCRAASAVMILLMVTMFFVINALVVTRYFFSYSPSWTEEVTRYSMIWLVMLGAGVLALFDDHITLNMAVDLLPPKLRAWQRLFVQLFVLAIALLIVWEGFPYALGMEPVIMPALQVSMVYAAVSVPIGGILIAAFAAMRVVIEIANIAGCAPPAIPDQFEFMDNSFKPVDEQDPAAAPAANAASQGGVQ